MKQIIRLGILSAAMVLGIVGNSIPVVAVGNETKHLIIAEVSPESAQAAGEEYVELFNPNAEDIDISGWQLQYRSYSHPTSDNGSWSIRAILGCKSTKTSDCAAVASVIIGAGDTLRLSSYETGDGVQPLEAGMATTGGEVRLAQPSVQGTADVVHDMVGYGTAKAYEGGNPSVAPKPGRSIMRVQDDNGDYVDTDQNGADFLLTPDESASGPQEPVATTDNNADGQQTGQTTQTDYPDAEITEVLPDPASPQMDSADEFIELYNPYGEALDLTDYTIKTGADWSHTYTIDQVVVGPYGYVSLTSAQTHLSLSNSGSGVRLYDPNGKLLFEVPAYGKAKTGDSWVRDTHGQWVWTTKPTPGEANIVDEPVAAQPAAATSAAKKSTAKTTSASKKTSTPKSTTAAVKGTTTSSQPAGPGSTNNQTGLWVMAGAGVLGAGYALYEYRQDISDFIRRRWQTVVNFGRAK